jgi:large subunit ribosomal protein L1
MSKNSKAYRAAAEKVDRTNLYTPLQAAKLAKETSSAKQDATVEVAIRLGVDPRKADQMVRGTVNLPHGTGKTARVAVFAVGEKAEQAQAAGADIVGSDDLIEKIQGGFLDFDAAIATPDQMAKVGRIARILGPRGLMPNPKTGTVTPDVTKAIADIKGGKINFRIDKQANLHFIIGRASFDEKVGPRLHDAVGSRGISTVTNSARWSEPGIVTVRADDAVHPRASTWSMVSSGGSRELLG